MSTSPSSSGPLETGHAPVNGIRIYHEIHGRADGVPLAHSSPWKSRGTGGRAIARGRSPSRRPRTTSPGSCGT